EADGRTPVPRGVELGAGRRRHADVVGGHGRTLGDLVAAALDLVGDAQLGDRVGRAQLGLAARLDLVLYLAHVDLRSCRAVTGRSRARVLAVSRRGGAPAA